MYIIAFLLIAGGFCYLIFSSIKSSSVYFLNVSEAIAKSNGNIGRARLFGKVGKDIEKVKSGIEFSLLDKKDPSKKIIVDYYGNIPDTFKTGSEVIVEGTMEHGRFKASVLMTKCPSKYQKKS